MASRGMAPDTIWDFAYHAFAIAMLLAGLWVALRLRPTERRDDSRATVGSYRRGGA